MAPQRSKSWRRQGWTILRRRDSPTAVEDYEVKYWSKTLGETREQLQKAIAKVSNSAAAVRKELAA
jgi:hypothetical protein